MRVSIHEGGVAAPAKRDEMPIGASAKREIKTLTENLEALRHRVEWFIPEIATLQNRLTKLESEPSIVSIKGERGEKGDRGERGEQGMPGETRIIAVAPEDKPLKQGAWYRFWRRFLLGIE